MALGVVRDLRSPQSLDGPGGACQEHLMAGYVLARLAAGADSGTLDQPIDHSDIRTGR